MQVAVPGINVVNGDRESTVQWPDFGPGRNYVVQLEQPDGTWEPLDVPVEAATDFAPGDTQLTVPSKTLDHQATIDGLKNGRTYRARIVAAPTKAEAVAATEPALAASGVRGGAAVSALARTAEGDGGAVTTAPILITPLAVPPPSSTSSVITVKVGGDRSGQTGVTPLAGVTLQLYDGSTGTPGAAITAPWGTCVSDADGDCSFTVPSTNLSPGQGGNQNRRFWIQRTGVPTGWYAINALRVGDIPTPNTTTPYRFRTGTALLPNVTYTSLVNFMISTGTAVEASGGIWQTSRNNPTFPAQCGADVALVLDLSGSVGSALPNLQAAARQFVGALVGTPSRVALFTFASNAPANATNNQNRPLTAVSTSAGVTTVNNWINGLTVATSPNNATNWDRALAQVANDPTQYDVAVVITDGDPTVYNTPAQGPGDRTRFRELENGVFSANAVKAEGTRLIAFGVGSGVSGNSANLQSISGTTANSDYFQTTDYAAAGNTLRALALGSCQGSLSVIKMVVPPTGTIADGVPTGGWDFTATTSTSGVTLSPTSGTTAGGTGALSFNLTFPGGVTTAPVTATETQQSGYTLVQVAGANAVCTRLDTSAAVPVVNASPLGFTVTASADYPVSCRVYNRAPQPAASLLVTKKWNVNGTVYDDGDQPEGLSAQLRVVGGGLNGDQEWDTELTGFQQGNAVTLSETTDIDRGQCVLTSSRLTVSKGTPTDQPLPYSTSLSAGLNTFEMTNTVTCPTTLTLTKEVANGTASPTSWTLNAAAPTGALPGPTGVTETPATTDVPVTPDALYTLSESGGNPAYIQEVGQGAVAIPGSTVSWFCSQVDANGVVIPGFADGLNGGVRVPIGYRVVCNAINETALLQLIKVVQGGTAVPTDWALTATPTGTPPTGLTPVTVTSGAPAFPVRPGQQYALTESTVAGYHLDAVECRENSPTGPVRASPGGLILPEVGQTLICTFTNVRDTAQLRLVKQVVNDNGGTAVAGDWTLSATPNPPIGGQSPVSGPGGTGPDPVTVYTGTYNLSESVGPPGYDAGAWSCTGTGTLVGTQLTLGRDQSATCTIVNNDQPARLTLVKQVVNDDMGSAVPADWTLTATPDGIVGQGPVSGNGDPADPGGVNSREVFAGTYTLSESGGPAGYTAGTWSCATTEGLPVSVPADPLVLGVGQSVTCTIVNDDQPTYLTLHKSVVNNSGGTAAPTDWLLSAAGPTPISGRHNTLEVTRVKVAPGSYVLSESGGPAGYLAGAWSCLGATSVTGSTVVLTQGDSAVCEIQNADQPAQLTLVKQVVNDDLGSAVPADWTLTATPDGIVGQGPVSGKGDPTDPGGVALVEVFAGTYTLSESGGPAGYTAGTWSCATTEGLPVSVPADPLVLGVGQSVTCTIVNDDQPTYLTLHKSVVNNSGGTAAPTDWLLSAAGPTPISGRHNTLEVTRVKVAPGSYVLSESGGPSGYLAGDWSCQGATSVTGSTVVLTQGDSAVCEIQNNDEPAQLTLVKTVTNDHGGTAVRTDWILSATSGPTPITGRTGDAAITDAVVSAGRYTLVESGPGGYTPGTWECTAGTLSGSVPGTAQLTLALGESATCTINNDDQPAQLTLRKIVDPAQSGTGRVPSNWMLTAEPDGSTSQGTVTGNGDPTSPGGVFQRVVFAGAYTLSEAGPDGFTRSAWSCMGGVLAGDVVTVPNGGNVVCEIRNTAVAPTLTLVKVVDPGTTGDTTPRTEWILRADGPTPISGRFGDASVTDAVVHVGTYDLSESVLPGWTASDWVCTGTFESSDAGSVTLLEGDDATCTITNTAVPPRLTLIKHVVNGPYGNAVPADWTLTAASPGQTITGPGNSPTVTDQQVQVGAYALTETADPLLSAAFTAGAWSCTGATSFAGSSVTIGLGQDVTCEITNTRNSANITLQKRWVNAHAGDTATLRIDGTQDGTATSTAPAAPSASNSVTVREFAGETVDLSETLAGAGIYETDLSCDQPGLTWTEGELTATYTAPLGTLTDVVCTFTNTGLSNPVRLQKIWRDAYAGDTARLSIVGGLPGAQSATSTATGAAGDEQDTANTATAEVLVGATASVAEVLGEDNVGTYTSPPTIVCTAGEVDVTVTNGSFTMPGAEVDCTILNEREVVPPGRPDVSAVTCTVGDPPALVAGTITIPENSDYAFTINGTPYGPGTYTFDAGTYHVTATLIRGTEGQSAAARTVQQLAQATYEWDVTIVAPSACPGLSKTADPPNGSDVEQGDVITYTITVQNIGSDPVQDETVVDTLPDGVELIESSVNPAADFDAGAGTLTWTIDLPAGSEGAPSELRLTYQVEVTTDDGTLVNTARWVERDLTVQTTHYVTPPPEGPPELPHTGAGDIADVTLAGLLLLGGGALVTLGVRRRRREE